MLQKPELLLEIVGFSNYFSESLNFFAFSDRSIVVLDGSTVNRSQDASLTNTNVLQKFLQFSGETFITQTDFSDMKQTFDTAQNSMMFWWEQQKSDFQQKFVPFCALGVVALHENMLRVGILCDITVCVIRENQVILSASYHTALRNFSETIRNLNPHISENELQSTIREHMNTSGAYWMWAPTENKLSDHALLLSWKVQQDDTIVIMTDGFTKLWKEHGHNMLDVVHGLTSQQKIDERTTELKSLIKQTAEGNPIVIAATVK